MDRQDQRFVSAIRSAFVSLLLAAPLAAMADSPPPAKVETPARATPSGKPLVLTLSRTQLQTVLSATPSQVPLDRKSAVPSGNEPPDPAIPVITVEASAPATSPSVTRKVPCGFASIAHSIAHPADAWREVAPLPAGSDVNACVESAGVTEKTREAFPSVRGYK